MLTLLPAAAALAFLNQKYHIRPWSEHVPVVTAWLLGTIVGAVTFYDLPIAGYTGFRPLLLARSPYAEFWLVLVWSALCALPGFIVLFVSRASLFGLRITFANIWDVVVRPSGLVMIITSLTVGAFMLAYSDRLKFEQARGMIAAIFLRTTMFVSVFIAMGVGRQHSP